MDTLIIQRSIKLDQAVPEQDKVRLVNELENHNGIDAVKVESGKIIIDYNVFVIRYANIVSLLHECGHDTDRGFISDFKTALYDLQDRNEIAQASSPFGYANEIRNIYLKCRQQAGLAKEN